MKRILVATASFLVVLTCLKCGQSQKVSPEAETEPNALKTGGEGLAKTQEPEAVPREQKQAEAEPEKKPEPSRADTAPLYPKITPEKLPKKPSASDMPPPLERDLVFRGDTVPAKTIVRDAEILFQFIEQQRGKTTSDDRRNAVRVVLNRWVEIMACEKFLKLAKVPIPTDEAEADLARKFRMARKITGVKTMNQFLARAGFSKEYLLRQLAVTHAFRDYSARHLPDEIIRERFDRHPKLYELIRISQILIGNRMDRKQPETIALIKKARKRIQRGEPFALVAYEMSEDPASAQRGGDMGWFNRGELPRPMAKEVFKMKIGQVSEIVATEVGFHVIKVTDRTKSFEQVLKAVRARKGGELRIRAYNDMLAASVPIYGGKPYRPLGENTW